MTEYRYQLARKIGQGGVGVVYKAFDRHLNRDVAIKRVLADGGYENQEEATEAMLKEATSLCSIQHPHIVTVFDAGVDEDGPYVIMELLSGRTLDEMVERGILVSADFREVAVQSQEAMIAAQDLDLVHRDIKPTNIMVTWLPSGRFQIKLVDFGLAKFSPKPSLQTIDHGDAVFGSIHFMAPEQFERTPLDKRTDMYSLGCVYYYCLTGRYPFDGENAARVMNAHLQHEVTPIAELRPDLPPWAADWVMWHLSRKKSDRPRDARESLKKFLMSENDPNAGTPEVPVDPSQPGAPAPQEATGPVNTSTAPQSIEPPAGQAPSVHPAPQQPARPKLLIPGQVPPPAAPAQAAPVQAAPVQAAPAYVAPPQVAQPVAPAPPAAPAPVAPVQAAPVQAAPVQAAPVQMAQPQIAQPVAQTPMAPLGTTPVQPQPQTGGIGIGSVAAPGQRKGMSNAVKGMIAAALVAGLIVAGFVFVGKSKQNDRIERLNEITAAFKDPENPPSEVNLSGSDVQLLLDNISTAGTKQQGERKTFLQALLIGKATDDTDISEEVAKYAKDIPMDAGARIGLFQLIGGRGDESALPHLIEFASKTNDTSSGQAALNAARNMASTENFQSLLGIVTNSSSASIKNSARDVLSDAVSKSEDPTKYATAVVGTYKNTTDEDSKIALLRLMGASGGDEAAGIIGEALEGDNEKMKVAAAFALRYWPNDSQFETLYDYTTEEQDDGLRKKAFEALVDFLNEGPEIDDDDLSLYWGDVASIATGPTEQKRVIDSMVSQDGAWADDILDYFVEEGDNEKIQFHAEKAKDRLAIRTKRAKRSGTSSDDEEEEEEEDEEEEEMEEEEEPEEEDTSEEEEE